MSLIRNAQGRRFENDYQHQSIVNKLFAVLFYLLKHFEILYKTDMCQILYKQTLKLVFLGLVIMPLLDNP